MSREDGVGRFSYADDYLSRSDGIAIDPWHLPLQGGIFSETRLNGTFGVFYDRGPSDLGLAALERRCGTRWMDDPLGLLEQADGDAFGAVEVGFDIAAKRAFVPPDSGDLAAALERLPADAPALHAVCALTGVPVERMVRHRPKLTVRHRGQHWLAKMAASPADASAPLLEFLAMRCAKSIGVDVAEVELLSCGSHLMLLVRRFDRRIDGRQRMTRSLYLSGQTLLGLDFKDPADGPLWSYVAMADRFESLSAHGVGIVQDFRRELYRRLVVNAVCGNADDHPLNHGWLYQGGWRLSPAFDICPSSAYRGKQAMALTSSGERRADRRTLLQACTRFGWARGEASDFIEEACRILSQGWRDLLAVTGGGLAAGPPPDPRLWLDDQENGQDKLDPRFHHSAECEEDRWAV